MPFLFPASGASHEIEEARSAWHFFPNPEGLDRLPRETLRFAAGLAAGYSKAREGGRVAVHVATCAEISKPRGLPPGKVVLARYKSVDATPLRGDEGA